MKITLFYLAFVAITAFSMTAAVFMAAVTEHFGGGIALQILVAAIGFGLAAAIATDLIGTVVELFS